MKNLKIVIIGLFIMMVPGFLFSQKESPYVLVEARTNSMDSVWVTYKTQTIEKIPGFVKKKEPRLNEYGSWMQDKRQATGFFRTEMRNDRWWIIDPEGYPFYFKGVASFSPGGSDNQRQILQEKFGNDSLWALNQSQMLKSYGFNGLGSWAKVEKVRNMKTKIPYTVIVNPMQNYKSVHVKRYGGKYNEADWHGYRFDLVMVFDAEFDYFVNEAVKSLEIYKNDKYVIGYFTDNELPWRADALDIHLNKLAKDEAGYLVAHKWLTDRKGNEVSLQDITEEDRKAFFEFYFETYLQKVTSALRKIDPNHLYLGCRFHAAVGDLTNKELFQVAGKYMDIISINHYRKWQPDQNQMNEWYKWSGKPFLITEWYTKGEDSGLPNNTGAGWNVRTQLDRGYFYQNFTIELLRNKASIGWNWFTYQDNDPTNLRADISNRDSNKGLVDAEFNEYQPLLLKAKEVNSNVWNLINFFDKASE